jgi:hypothetical protein
MSAFFPEDSDNAKEKEFYTSLNKRTILTLKSIAEKAKDKYKEKIAEIDDFLMGMARPQKFYGAESSEVLFIKNFEKSCVILSQHVSRDPKKMTVLEYMETSAILKKQLKQKEKNAKKNKR